MKDQKTKVFFSSSWQTHADLLASSLFEDGTPFARRCVILPSDAMKESIMHHLAKGEEGVAFGVEFVTLQGLLRKACTLVEGKKLPARLELSLALERVVMDLLQYRQDQENLSSLYLYLDKVASDPYALRDRVINLCEELSAFFYEKSLQSKEEIEAFTAEGTWQAELYQKVFASPFFTPLYPILYDAILPWDSIHVLGFFFIPPKIVELMSRAPLYLYVFSPTEYFWEDLCSDKERLFLQRVLEGKKAKLKVQQQMMLYLKEDNPLIGSWARAGKAFLKVLAPFEPFFEEHYSMPKSEETLLSNLHRDFLHLAADSPPSFSLAGDSTVQIHACPAKHREVEVVLEIVLKAIKQREKQGGAASGAGILVVSAMLSSFVPYIHKVFSAAKLPYRILDVPSQDTGSLASAFEHFFSMVGGRLDRRAVVELLSFSPLQRKYELKGEEMGAIFHFLHDKNIQWGYDSHHRKQQLSALLGDVTASLDRGSWEWALDHIFKTLASCEMGFGDFTISSIEAIALGKLAFILRAIFDDLTTLSTLSEPFIRAKETIKKILLKHFDGAEESPFFSLIEEYGKDFEGVDTPFTFRSFARILSFATLKMRTSFQRSNLSAVTFSSFEPGMLFDASVVIVMGADEVSLPRREAISPFINRGISSSVSVSSSKEDADRFLFMQALITAKELFAATYSCISQEDGKLQGPSVLVQELISYVEERYGVKKCIYHHPATYYSDSSFSSASPFIPISSRAMDAARAAYGSNKKVPAPLFSFTQDRALSQASCLQTVSVKDLISFARHPIRHMLQKEMGMYFASFFEKQEQNFALSPLLRHKVRTSALKQSAETIVSSLKERGNLPMGPFEGLAACEIQDIVHQTQKSLVDLGIQPDSFFTLSLTDRSAVCHREKSFLFVPQATVESDGGVWQITGDIEGVCSQGITFDAEDGVEDLIRVWPAYLLFLIAAEKASLPGRDLLLLKSGKRIPPANLNPLESLSRFLVFYSSCKLQGFVCQPSWHTPLFEGDNSAYDKAFDARQLFDTSRYCDPYLQFVYLKDRPIPFSEMLPLWQRFCMPFYQDIDRFLKGVL